MHLLGAPNLRSLVAAIPGCFSIVSAARESHSIDQSSRRSSTAQSGQSLSKRVLDIRLESATDTMVVGVGSTFAREIVHVLDQFMFLGYLRPLWDPERRTFADGLMGTRVVSDSLRWV